MVAVTSPIEVPYKAPARSTLRDEIITLRPVLKTAIAPARCYSPAVEDPGMFRRSRGR